MRGPNLYHAQAMSRNQVVGRDGEGAAAAHLEALGYTVLAKNIRTPYGEIDIVAEHEGTTVFVEVKTRTSATFGPPEIAVSNRKRQHMEACAAHYCREHSVNHWRIDVIAVVGSAPHHTITHFENATGGEA